MKYKILRKIKGTNLVYLGDEYTVIDVSQIYAVSHEMLDMPVGNGDFFYDYTVTVNGASVYRVSEEDRSEAQQAAEELIHYWRAYLDKR